jgi:hypothetical protein
MASRPTIGPTNWTSDDRGESSALSADDSDRPERVDAEISILELGYYPKTRIFAPCAESWLPVRSHCFGSAQANAICSHAGFEGP